MTSKPFGKTPAHKRPRLFIFNPETDFALAVGEAAYTPPRQVEKMKRQMTLLPALLGSSADYVVATDNNDSDMLFAAELILKKGIRIITAAEIKTIISPVPTPWGWDNNIRKWFLKNGVDESLLPTTEFIEARKRLSHRRSSIAFLKAMGEYTTPEEFFSPEEALQRCHELGNTCLKMPWSSSGKGIIFTSHTSQELIDKWIRGTIKRQGSVIIEKEYDKDFDFASEWILEKGNAHFEGLSIFKTKYGRYQGNLCASQSTIRDIIKRHNVDIIQILNSQKETLEKLIAADYEGPVGIDMFTTHEGYVNPCVEINMRMTMGFIAKGIYDMTGKEEMLLPMVTSSYKD